MTTLPKLPAAYLAFLEQHDGDTCYLFNDIDGWRLADSFEQWLEMATISEDDEDDDD